MKFSMVRIKNLLTSRNEVKAVGGLILITFVIAWIIIWYSQLTPERGLIIEPSVLSASILQGESFHDQVAVVNRSNLSWELVSAKPSCGCMQATFKSTILSPQSSTKVNVFVDTSDARGEKASSIAMEWCQKDNPNIKAHITLYIRLMVQYLFVLEPRHINLGKIKPDSFREGFKFQVRRGNSKINWNQIIAKCPSFEINVTRQNQSLFQLTAHPKFGVPSYGYYSRQIEITAATNTTAIGPTYILPIKAWIDPGVEVSPRTLFLSNLSFGQTTPAVISLSAGNENLRLLSVTSPEPDSLHFDSSLKKNSSTIQIYFTAIGSKPGPHSGVVSIAIALNGNIRTISVPYIMFVKSN